jgi:hypothetical protein
MILTTGGTANANRSIKPPQARCQPRPRFSGRAAGPRTNENPRSIFINARRINTNPRRIFINARRINIDPWRINTNPARIFIDGAGINKDPAGIFKDAGGINLNDPAIFIDPAAINEVPACINTDPAGIFDGRAGMFAARRSPGVSRNVPFDCPRRCRQTAPASVRIDKLAASPFIHPFIHSPFIHQGFFRCRVCLRLTRPRQLRALGPPFREIRLKTAIWGGLSDAPSR